MEAKKMEYSSLRLDCADNIAHIVMDSRASLNALDIPAVNQLAAAFEQCEHNPEVRVIVLSGAGRAFCGGGNIAFFAEEVKKNDFTLRPLISAVAELTLRMKKCPKPVIAAVHGAAAGGGCNLALACDMIIAADNAKFIQAFVNIGLVPDAGGGFWLPRIIGTSRAFEMFATGRPVLAEEALALGLVSEICAPEELINKAMALAAKLAAGPGVAYANIKKILFASMYQGFAEFIPLESSLQDEAAKTADFAEGVNAFMGRRKPAFHGK
jgi:2-(1,2-epoxy-1,2-dihydrophenyl)acetyl-CoA isomerase